MTLRKKKMMLNTTNKFEHNFQTGLSDASLLNQNSSLSPLTDSDRLVYDLFFSSSQQLFSQREETGKEKLKRLHNKMIQDIKEMGEDLDNPIEKMSLILGRFNLRGRKLEKIIFSSHT